MNKTFKQLFYTTVAWNTLDAVGTQSLVVIHHVLLQMYAGAELHGIIGTIFSILYMAVLLANMGFDFSCAPFMSYYTADTEKFYSFIRTKFLAQVLWICVCASIGCIMITRTGLSDSLALTFALALTFITESIKKTLKVLLQLLFYTKYTAIVECTGMISYMIVAWAWYSAYGIHLLSTFCILCAISTSQMICFGIIIYYWYRNAPHNIAIEKPSQLTVRITKTRLWVSAQRGVDQLFSNNFLVPFFALSCGLSYAGYFKIISSIARWVSLFGDKAFGITSLMFLSKSPGNYAEFLPFVNRLILLTISIALPTILTISTFVGYYYCSVTSLTLLILCSLLIVLRFIDMGCIAYERWLLIHEYMAYSVTISLCTTAVVYSCITYMHVVPAHAIVLLIGARITQILLYTVFFKYKKNKSLMS